MFFEPAVISIITGATGLAIGLAFGFIAGVAFSIFIGARSMESKK